MTEASFEVDVSIEDVATFSKLSGDWNPLHNDLQFARTAGYERQVLHGAFSAGLVSRLAGMHIPGRSCLLHSLTLRFVAPILPPVRLRVSGRLVGDEHRGLGNVEATVQDATTGNRYVDATYAYSRSSETDLKFAGVAGVDLGLSTASTTPVLVTGASGGLGQAILSRLGGKGLGVSRSGFPGSLTASTSSEILEALADRRIGGIIHCGWPMPDNDRLTALGNVTQSVEHHISAPLSDVISLAQLLSQRGVPNAMLILIGSTFAESGEYGQRMPLYSLVKSTIPRLAQILAIELASSGHRCAAVIFDVVDGGMNKSLSRSARAKHSDRSPFGRISSIDEAASQVLWLLSNESILASGAAVKLSGGAIP